MEAEVCTGEGVAAIVLFGVILDADEDGLGWRDLIGLGGVCLFKGI